jgi:hypothetical protein
MHALLMKTVNSARSLISQLKERIFGILSIDEKLDEMKINQGLILSLMQREQRSKSIQDYEFKVFSQWGEDGIIQHLTRALEIKNKTFIEFGVESFFESNCRFLMMKDNWSGFVIDGSSKDIKRLKNSYFYWRYDINAVEAFITRENINELLLRSAFDEDIGILSIDIDGNDYHILEAISTFKPRILICEYNAVFGGTRKISIPYDPAFNRTDGHYSHLYWGASLSALSHLAWQKGYSLIGTNSAGSNAFYVRNDLLTERVEVLSAPEIFIPSKIRDSRNLDGVLTYVGGSDRLKLIQGLPVVNVETGKSEAL